MITAGIWPDRKRLVVVILDDAERARRPILARRDAAAESLVNYLVSEMAEIVLVESLLTEPIGRAAAHAGTFWIASLELIAPIREAAKLSPRTTATMLARLPRRTMLRRQLRRHRVDPRQLTLL